MILTLLSPANQLNDTSVWNHNIMNRTHHLACVWLVCCIPIVVGRPPPLGGFGLWKSRAQQIGVIFPKYYICESMPSLSWARNFLIISLNKALFQCWLPNYRGRTISLAAHPEKDHYFFNPKEIRGTFEASFGLKRFFQNQVQDVAMLLYRMKWNR